MKKAFTLVEMLVVIGIIAILMGASLGAYSKMTKSADKTRGQEIVSNTATALATLFAKEGAWPQVLRENGKTDGRLDKKVAYPLAKGGYMSLSWDGKKNGGDKELKGLDRFGIVTPWALAHIKSTGDSAALGDRIVGNSTLQDHILHFALDLDGDGIIQGASVGGENVDVRATAIVWSVGPSGKLEAYSEGIMRDGIYSWTKGQTRNVK